MIIKVKEKKEGSLFLVIEGFFDCTETVDYDKFIENELPKYEFNEIVFDFSKLEFIDSMGMGRLVMLKRKLQKDNKDLKIINVSDDVKSIFKIAEVADLLLKE
ncbi:MAG TPA: STAS domain-containing protein [Spirochaetota bacterium]|nr:STAS domain-containing protein [Spirochaetota bacterium]HOM38228.1 STAS domain-containing protein [Spirochaetota bacterium]HPQ48554.1 STAS domain-containing protein [Spirochaetota bacterium]